MKNLKPIIARAMKEASSINEFKSLLKRKNIRVILRRNKNNLGQIYGATISTVIVCKCS
jgi:ribosomal protein L7Ae-like RNA K-turn-binding protein